ncbi:MAG: aminodeoxychorismate synthase component I [Flavobacteriaceae bacterium]|nr:aminodeoxychorismate synthase component I [Flavobacteriaceae bacterium]
MNTKSFKTKVNDYTKRGIPFLFLIDFEMQKPFVCKLDELNAENIFYQINGKGNLVDKQNINPLALNISQISKEKYNKSFLKIKKSIHQGDTYLLNLTFKNDIEIKSESKYTLKEILQIAKANYKLYFKDTFISFSPESFIKIKEGKIYTYPMKGTIDASIKNAETIILNDVKETQEHNTIVDLLRNDLALVATKIKVNKFRYIDKIKTQKGEILQVSSEIEGYLSKDWKENFGNILLKLLPAGSISGAPKTKTIEIIKNTENSKRGYYTGVFGVFDGLTVDSAVLIRYIEKNKTKLIYRSGGGITYLSNVEDEYKELLQKIYIPK